MYSSQIGVKWLLGCYRLYEQAPAGHHLLVRLLLSFWADDQVDGHRVAVEVRVEGRADHGVDLQSLEICSPP